MKEHFYSKLKLLLSFCLLISLNQVGLTQCPGFLGTGVTTVAAVPYSDIGHNTAGDVDDITETNAPNSCNGFYLRGEDHVYIFTPTTTGSYDFFLENQSSVWGGFHIFDACPDVGNCIAGSVSSSASEGATVTLTAGTTYYIVVDIYATPTTYTYDFRIEETPPPPANDDCTTATAIACGQTLTGQTTAQATDNGDDVGCGQGQGVWYEFTPTDIGTATITVTPIGTFDAEIGLATSADCVTFVNVDCEDGTGGTGTETLEFGYIADTTYYIYIGHYFTTSTTVGDFDIALTCVACLAPSFTTTVDTEACPAISVDVDVTSLGSASRVNISNNLNANVVAGASTGVSTLSGFALGDGTVTIYVADTADPTCIDSTTVSIPNFCPPDNDDCISATLIACGDTLMNQTTLGATGSLSTSCIGSQGNNVWYSFVGTDETVTITIDTTGVAVSNFIGQIDIYESTDNTCNTITCVSGGGSGENPVEETFTALVGTTYYISIGHWIQGSPDGNFNIAVDCVCIPPAFTATLDDDACPALNIDVDVTALNSASTVNISNSVNASTAAGVTTGISTLTGFNLGDGIVMVYVEDAANPTCIDSLTVLIPNGCPPANDVCSSATPLTVNPDFSCAVVATDSLSNATASGEDDVTCGGTPDDDLWYTFVATDTVHYVSLINISGGTTDLYHAVWSGSCGSFSNIICSDPNNSTVEGLTVGETYLLRVYSWTSTPGQTSVFDVCIGTAPPPPANDECANAEMLTMNPDYNCTVFNSGTIASATPSPVDTCGGTPDDDVWYYFTATNTDHRIEITNVSGSTTDMYHEVLDACSGGASIICSDGNTSNASTFVPGNDYYVRVYTWTSTEGQTSSFDICVSEPPTCPVPTGLAVSNETDTSLDVAWTTGGGAVSNIVIEVCPADTLPGDPLCVVFNTAASPFNVTGLSPRTEYDIYIKEQCVLPDESTYAGPVFGDTVGPDVDPNPTCTDIATYPTCSPNAFYNVNDSITYNVCPANANDTVSVTFTYFDLEVNTSTTGECYDFINVVDATTGTNFGEFCSEASGSGDAPAAASDLSLNPTFTAEGPGNCLTITFDSDDTVSETGFSFTVNCLQGSDTCPITLYVPGPVVGGVYSAQDNVNSDGLLDGSGAVTMEADTICLNPNFEVPLGTEFNAIINPCTPRVANPTQKK